MIDVMVETTHPDLTTRVVEELQRRAESICDASGSSHSLLSLLLVDDDAIRELNHRWRGIDSPTDVLSFALAEAEDAHLHPELLGDIVISVETASRLVADAEHRGRVAKDMDLPWGLEEELLFLFVHGFLHLLGHDHLDAEEEERMKAEEKRLFRLGLQGRAPA